MAAPNVVELRGVSKRYGEVIAAEQVSFALPAGELLALVGASGCGKTTTLRLIAGLDAPDAGDILLDARRVSWAGNAVPPEDRRVGMVFQDYALFPHLSVKGNLAFALHGWKAAEREARIDDMLTLVGLASQAGRYPHELSGGQQQRVALARALAANPAVVLLDEPFSNLDAALRRDMRAEVRRILKEAGATAVFVTHDQEEALSIADRVAVMARGRVLQIGAPRSLYLQPESPALAEFLGEVNWLEAEAQGEVAETPFGAILLAEPKAGRVRLGLRPENLRVAPAAPGVASVVDTQFYGHDQLVTVRLDDGTIWQARAWASDHVRPGERVNVALQGTAFAFSLDDEAWREQERVQAGL
jgi:iron(III) transport system ATP-binding protein